MVGRAPGHVTYDSERYAGDGWVAVGDVAFFVNPLFSPGLAYGFTMTHVAARTVAAALEAGDVSAEALAGYDDLARAIFETLLRTNEMLYRSARHPDMFEQVYLFWCTHNITSGFTAAHGEDGVAGPLRPKGNVPPPTVGGVLDPAYTERAKQIVAIQRDGEASGEDAAETARKVAAVIAPALDEVKAKQAYQRLQPWRVFRDFDADLQRRDADQWEPLLEFWRCDRCDARHSTEHVSRCVVCGEPRPA